MNIILIGFMGSGKSSTARFISRNYSFRFVDSDRIIEKKLKMSVREIFENFGENFFRSVERDIISSNLFFCSDCVIATGGGLPCHFNNIELLKKIGWVFYLKLSFEDIINRVKNKKNRPLLDNIEEARSLFDKRASCYKNAHFIIDASRNTEEIARDIIFKISS